MKKRLKILKKNVMLNLFQHRKNERCCERPCDPESNSGRRGSLHLFIIFMAICSVLVFINCESFAADTNQVQTPVAQVQEVPKNAVTPTTIPEKNAYNLTHMEKNGFKYSIFKFLAAMAGVLVSALAIFLGLNFYKKFALKSNQKLDSIDFDKTLESPKDFREAINLFLDKTDK